MLSPLETSLIGILLIVLMFGMGTSLTRSLKLRHPWLQINLLTAFVAAAVVGAFEDTLSRLVILAVFAFS